MTTETIRMALTSARKWIDFFVKEFDVDPATSSVTVRAVSEEGPRDVAKVTLAESLEAMDAAIVEAGGVHA